MINALSRCYERLLARLMRIEAETSHLLHQDLTEHAKTLIVDADRLIAFVEAEKAALKDQIDALTREITRKDALIEAARQRAAHAHEVAETLKATL